MVTNERSIKGMDLQIELCESGQSARKKYYEQFTDLAFKQVTDHLEKIDAAIVANKKAAEDIIELEEFLTDEEAVEVRDIVSLALQSGQDSYGIEFALREASFVTREGVGGDCNNSATLKKVEQTLKDSLGMIIDEWTKANYLAPKILPIQELVKERFDSSEEEE